MTIEQRDSHSDPHVFFADNTLGRDFIAPDLHGHEQAFFQALAEVNFDPRIDRVFAVGDLIDRGPNSLNCLKLLEEPWFATVLGNHEQMLIDSVVEENTATWGLWLTNGGGWSVDISPHQLALYAERLQQLPLTFTIQVGEQQVGICHAQYRLPSWLDRLAANSEQQQDWLWGRSRLKFKDKTRISDVDWVFSGHTVVKCTTALGNNVFIETGAYVGSPVNLINLHQWLKAT